jgi:hypothetical protein
MSTDRINGISLIVNNSGHIAFNADVSFSVEEKENIKSVHVSDVIYTLILSALKEQASGAHLLPGDYRMVLTSCLSAIAKPEEQVSDDSTFTEPVAETGDASEDVSEETSETGGEAEEEGTEEEEAPIDDFH